MENTNNYDPFDLGSEPAEKDFDPFETDEIGGEKPAETAATQETETETPTPEEPESIAETSGQKENIADSAVKATEPKSAEKSQPNIAEKPPVFEYAGATENIDDTSKTFDELRIEKSTDFPELEDGKRVSWTVEYGKIVKTVAEPKGTSIGKMKADIETSKEFLDSLKKARDKNPACKVKPRVTAQSKGTAPAYKGVFANIDEAELSGKVIAIVPARNGNVYEIRKTEMGKFITPIGDCEMLSDVRAGFIPALPRIPVDLMLKIIGFFRYFTSHGADNEVLINIYWDKINKDFVVDVPEQNVTKISVDSRISEDFGNNRYIHYMDIHSHNSMKAFFSAVDDTDEKATRLYTVIGRLDKFIPEIKTRISNGGKFWPIDSAEVFEPIGKAFPDEWKNNVHFRKPHSNKKSAFGDDSDEILFGKAS